MPARAAIELAGLVVVGAGLVLWVNRYAPEGAGASWPAAAVLAGVLYAFAAALALTRAAPPRADRRTAYLSTLALALAALLQVACAYRTFGGIEPVLHPAGPLGATVLMVLAVALLLARLAGLGWHGARLIGRLPPAAALRRSQPWSYPVVLLALTVLWLPSLILLAPGSVTYDGARQINELLAVRIPELDFTYFPTNHHPWFATLWQGSLLSAGLAASGGDINAGLLVHSAVLAGASLLTYACIIGRIQAMTGRVWMLAALLFFGLVPHFANYAMLYEKTGWYQLALIWFFLGVVDVVLRRGSMGVQLVQLAGGGLLTALFRSNGLYVVVPTLVVLALFLLGRADRRRLVTVGASAAAVVALFFGWSNAALPRWEVMPASPAEALVVPFQQVARIALAEGEELTPQQRKTIDEVLPLDALAGAYDPENGDGVKGLYEIDSFLITDVGMEKMRGREDWWQAEGEWREDLRDFLALWPQLVLQHPATAVSATLNNTYLYFAPPLNRGADISLFTGGLPSYFILANDYTADYRHLAGEEASHALSNHYHRWAVTPGLNMIVNPGLYGWIVIALGVSLAFWPNRARLLLYAPIALVWLINFAGARNGDFRYTVPLVALLPICLAAWFATRKTEAATAEIRQQAVSR